MNNKKKNKKESGFKMPEDYLEKFSEKLLPQLEEPSSKKLDKTSFKVPKNYWKKLELEVLQKTTEINKTPKKSLRLEPYFLVAAAIALIVVLAIGLNSGNSTEKSLDFASLEESELFNYLEDIYLEEPSNELIEIFPQGDMTWNMNDVTTIEEENILNYLEDTIDEMDEFKFQEDE